MVKSLDSRRTEDNFISLPSTEWHPNAVERPRVSAWSLGNWQEGIDGGTKYNNNILIKMLRYILASLVYTRQLLPILGVT